MVIPGVAPLTGALSREVNNVPWRQSNYMHVLVTATANQAENDAAARVVRDSTICVANEAPALPVVPVDRIPGCRGASASPPTPRPPSAPPTSCQDAQDHQATQATRLGLTSGRPRAPTPTSHISTLCVCISRMARREIQDKIPLFRHVVTVMVAKLLSV